MKRKRHAPAKIIRNLRTAEQLLNQGQRFADSCSDLKASACWQQLAADVTNCQQTGMK